MTSGFEKLPNQSLNMAQPIDEPLLTVRRRRLISRLLTDTLGSTAFAAFADVLGSGREGAPGLSPLALPAALGALAELPALRGGCRTVQ
jgi:hypothetical protein